MAVIVVDGNFPGTNLLQGNTTGIALPAGQTVILFVAVTGQVDDIGIYHNIAPSPGP